jgi:glycosyltransferase involved in cell wall biosynthesis
LAGPFSIVIPTYKERDNITPLVERLGKALAGREYEIVLMDDNSGDGSEELVASLSKKYPVRMVVRRGQKGLATAVMDGFGHARYDTILVMDADLQHPPEVVPSIIKAMDEGADVAVASRYVPGGGNEGWSKIRQVISSGAIFLAHLLLPLSRRVKDPMSGFFSFRRRLLKGVNPQAHRLQDTAGAGGHRPPGHRGGSAFHVPHTGAGQEQAEYRAGDRLLKAPVQPDAALRRTGAFYQVRPGGCQRGAG